jgi:hypothetical protein
LIKVLKNYSSGHREQWNDVAISGVLLALFNLQGKGETMNSNITEKNTTEKRRELNLEISLITVPSKLHVTGGREIPFNRAMLSITNTSDATVVGFIPHATLSQEGGSVQDVTEALSRTNTVGSLPPGETLKWDMHDLLLAEHPGVASKVHLWGYKAILNWRFDLTVWVEYRSLDGAAPMSTATSHWKFRWSTAKPPLEDVDLYIETVAD